MTLMEELPREVPYTSIMCLGCKMIWLSGGNLEFDPAEDVTYNKESHTWVCNDCYEKVGDFWNNYE